MERIGDVIDRDRWEHGSTGLAGREYPETDAGMPLDRTVCPACLGLAGAACGVCRGYAVCPDCRGAGWLADPGRAVRYHVCPSCGDAETGETGPRYGLPPRYANVTRKRQRVTQYQAAFGAQRRRAADPWEAE